MDNHSQCGKCGIVCSTHSLMDDHQCEIHEEQQADVRPEPEAHSAQQVEEGTRLQEGQLHQKHQKVPQPQTQVNADKNRKIRN